MPQMSCPGGLLGHARSMKTLPPSVLGEGTEMTPDEHSRRRDVSCLPLPVTPCARLCVRSEEENYIQPKTNNDEGAQAPQIPTGASPHTGR